MVYHAAESDALLAAATAERRHGDQHRRCLQRESIDWRKTTNKAVKTQYPCIIVGARNRPAG